jgi:hypothetical protein
VDSDRAHGVKGDDMHEFLQHLIGFLFALVVLGLVCEHIEHNYPERKKDETP